METDEAVPYTGPEDYMSVGDPVGINELSKKVNKINDIAGLDKYIKTNCAYDCKYFLLEKEDE